MLVNWYESMSESIQLLTASSPLNEKHKESSRPNLSVITVDLSGEWEIQEEDKVYQATLDTMRGWGLYMETPLSVSGVVEGWVNTLLPSS